MALKRTTEPQCASAKVLTRRPHPSLLRVISRKGKHPGRAYRIKRWDRYEVGMSLLHCRETAGLDQLDVLYFERHGLMALRDMTPEERREALFRWDGDNPTGDGERASSARGEVNVATSDPARHRTRVEPVPEVQTRPPDPGPLPMDKGTSGGKVIATYNALWGASRTARLASALALTNEQLKAVHGDLCRGLTEPGWPYGSASSINPLVVLLGASPGTSPQRGDRNYEARKPFDLPTAGEAHQHVLTYNDPRGFWDKMRTLGRTLLDPEGTIGDDALALFGTMNLSTVANSRASDVQVADRFARWVLHTIRNGLRPRVLVLLGLTTRLKDRALSSLFEEVFTGLDLRKPKREYALEVDPSFAFREWDLEAARCSPLLLVAWPQHSGKPPFVDSTGYMWRAACEQFRTKLSSRDPSLFD